ncbi:MAG: hypothetical protein ABJ327_20300 [Litoreibacter sp.]
MVAAEMTEPASHDIFVVQIVRGLDQKPRVLSIELANADMRNHYAFRNARELSDVFVEELAEKIRSVVGSVQEGDRIVTLPDFEMSLPGLLLSGLRVLLTKVEDGAEVIMMQFREYVGSIKSAFRFDPSFAVTSASVRERIAVEVLRDILTPLVDMINLNRPEYRAVIENHALVLQKRLDAIATRQDELNFYSGLLQRYVAGCRQDSSNQKLDLAFDDHQATGT